MAPQRKNSKIHQHILGVLIACGVCASVISFVAGLNSHELAVSASAGNGINAQCIPQGDDCSPSEKQAKYGQTYGKDCKSKPKQGENPRRGLNGKTCWEQVAGGWCKGTCEDSSKCYCKSTSNGMLMYRPLPMGPEKMMGGGMGGMMMMEMMGMPPMLPMLPMGGGGGGMPMMMMPMMQQDCTTDPTRPECKSDQSAITNPFGAKGDTSKDSNSTDDTSNNSGGNDKSIWTNLLNSLGFGSSDSGDTGAGGGTDEGGGGTNLTSGDVGTVNSKGSESGPTSVGSGFQTNVGSTFSASGDLGTNTNTSSLAGLSRILDGIRATLLNWLRIL